MKYLSITRPEIVEIKEMEKLKPKSKEVLIRTKASGICMLDVHTFTGTLSLSDYLSHPGHEVAGIVEEIGSEVSKFKPGDKVTALAQGTFAEYCVTSEEKVDKIPDDIEDFSLWISEPVACVVNGLRSMRLEPAQRIALIGCGYMGLLIIQGLPKEYLELIIAVDINEERLKLAKEFGADLIITSNETDLESEIKKISPKGLDVVIEVTGKPGLINVATSIVREGGQINIFGFHVQDELIKTGIWHMKGLKIINSAPNYSKNFIADFHDAVVLLKKGIFHQEKLITHRFNYCNAQKALEIAKAKSNRYIKGTILFPS